MNSPFYCACPDGRESLVDYETFNAPSAKTLGSFVDSYVITAFTGAPFSPPRFRHGAGFLLSFWPDQSTTSRVLGQPAWRLVENAEANRDRDGESPKGRPTAVGGPAMDRKGRIRTEVRNGFEVLNWQCPFLTFPIAWGVRGALLRPVSVLTEVMKTQRRNKRNTRETQEKHKRNTRETQERTRKNETFKMLETVG